MNLKFIVNDYVLIWNLLFQASINEKIHKLKQKLWINYKKEYNNTYRDKELILKDPKNFIPNDDTIYNIVLESKEYEAIKKKTEKYRNQVLKIWDENKKNTTKIIKDSKVNTIILGKHVTQDTSIKLLVEIIFKILQKEYKKYKVEYEEIVEAIIELAILNELPTRLTGRSYYLTGEPTLNYLKRQIYPYWLMYLGADKEEIRNYLIIGGKLLWTRR